MKLKPCPFCGKEPSLLSKGTIALCQTFPCPLAGLGIMVGDWNTRTDPTKTALAEALRECIKVADRATDGFDTAREALRRYDEEQKP